MPEPEDFPGPFPLSWGKDWQGLSEPLRNGPMMLSRMTDAATKAGHAIAAHQARYLSEAVADMRTLLSDSTPKAGDPTAMARACTAYLQAGMQRNFALLGFLSQTMAAMTQQMLAMPPMAQPPVACEEEPDPHPPQGPMTKVNGRAVSAKS